VQSEDTEPQHAGDIQLIYAEEKEDYEEDISKYFTDTDTEG
jgi:hypothetical protein